MAVTIDDALLKAANLDEYEFKLEIAIALFAQGRMTLAQASRFVGMSYMDFQALLSDREICVHYDFDDFRQDIQTLEQLSRI